MAAIFSATSTTAIGSAGMPSPAAGSDGTVSRDSPSPVITVSVPTLTATSANDRIISNDVNRTPAASQYSPGAAGMYSASAVLTAPRSADSSGCIAACTSGNSWTRSISGTFSARL